MRDRRLAAGFFILLATLFLLVNRGAYQGYFQDDDLDNLSFTRELGFSSFYVPLLYPEVFSNNFRPIGHLFYRILGQTAGFDYIPYVAFIQAVHLINSVLLWLILRRLGLSRMAAYAGAAFFVFDMAVFDVFWKPMYVFDLLCGALCLLSLLSYLQGRWILSLLAMFIAYRSKEVAVAFPVVLACYEWILGQKHWGRLIPFFGLSVIIGIQTLFQNAQQQENAYTLHFGLSSVWTCIQFYSSHVFLVPYAGFLILALLFLPDRRVRFGILSFLALLSPMLAVPGRLFSPYLYVPLIGLSIAAGALADRYRWPAIALFFALWLPWNFVNLRWQRRVALADARDRRTFVRELTDFSHQHSGLLAYIYNTAPVNWYGTDAIIKLAHPVGTSVRFATLSDPGVLAVLQSKALAVVSWDAQRHRLRTLLKDSKTPDASYLKMAEDTPIWQLGDGWYGFEDSFRWTKPYATARLWRPSQAREFELVVNVSPAYIQKVGRSHVVVGLDGSTVGEHDITRSGWQTVHWQLAPMPAGTVEASIRVTPSLDTGRILGIAVAGIGFRGSPAGAQ